MSQDTNTRIERIRPRIEEILRSYVAVRSDTNTSEERNVEGFFSDWFSQVPYFKANPDHCGLYPIPKDNLGRCVSWCMVKGKGDDTIVMIHHNDCVETVGYGVIENVCLDPDKLKKAYIDNNIDISDEVRKDLESGEWMFGRGVNDMKGGGSIQMALIEDYSRQEDFNGNIVLLSVPDEENLSAGMRGACLLLKELKEKYGLNYILMMDAEAHDRETPDVPIIHDGSVGKLMPVIHCRGKQAHVGRLYDGLNPINLLSEIIRRTEMNTFFIERDGNTVTPPATWLYTKDHKTVYDVTLPQYASGYMSILPLRKTTMEIMNKIYEISAEAFDQMIREMNESYAEFLKMGDQPVHPLPWKTNVKFYKELYDDAVRDSGEAFLAANKKAMEEIHVRYSKKQISIISAINKLIEVALYHVNDLSPVVVIALAPPYYPSVNNYMLPEEKSGAVEKAIKGLVDYAKTEMGQNYTIQSYYTSISDLSYAMFTASDDNIRYIEDNMLLWGDDYYIPLDIIKELSMAVVNIGPWGKGIHQYTERVYKEDLFKNTPVLIDKLVSDLLGN